MGLFSNSSSTRSQPDLSRYDYHYRGSHVNGYNVDSGSSATARQYVRQMALGAPTKKAVNTYPQTRRANSLRKTPTIRRNIPTKKPQPVYEDNDEFDYGEIDFDNNNQDDDDYPERYNSITSVTTTTTTTTKEIDPVTGKETVTKTVEKTLPDGSVETTIVKTEKPGTSRNNSFVGQTSPQKHNDTFNNFSSEHYTINSNEMIPEEEEYEDDVYHFSKASNRKHPQNRILKKHVGNKDVYTDVLEKGRMSESQMYAKALEIAREKVMSDPARLAAQNNVKQKKKGGGFKKNKYNGIGEDEQVLEPVLIPGKQKQYSLKRSLRDEPEKEEVYDDASFMDRSVQSEGFKKENKLKKGFKSLFKKKEGEKHEEQVAAPVAEAVPQNEPEEYEPVFTTQQNVAGDNLITKSLVDAGSDSEIEFLPIEENIPEEEEEEEPVTNTYSRSGNNVVRSDDYVESRDIEKDQVDYMTKKTYTADKQLAEESGFSEGDYIDFDDQEGEQKEEEDITELYNDVPDNVIAVNHTEIPDSSLLQDVPLLKTIQSENELRDALENIDEDKEVEVMRELTDKNKDEFYVPPENIDLIHEVDQHENTLVDENFKSKSSPEADEIIDDVITPESEKNYKAIDDSPLVIPDVDQVEVPSGEDDVIQEPIAQPNTSVSEPKTDNKKSKKNKKTKQGGGLFQKIVKFSNENYGANVSRNSSSTEKLAEPAKKKWKLFKKN